MVTRYGMSDALGPIQFGSENDEVFIGRDWGHTRNYSEDVAQLIDKEIKRIVEQGYERALKILGENMDIMHKTVNLLLEKEKITGGEFRGLFPEGTLPEKDRTDAMQKTIIAPDGEEPVEAAEDAPYEGEAMGKAEQAQGAEALDTSV
jgi:cell division protease FtsH